MPGPARVTVKTFAFGMGGPQFDSRQRQNPFSCEYKLSFINVDHVKEAK